MTDAEKTALAWLDKCIVLTPGNYVEVTDIVTVARTLKAMLAEPRLPKEPSEELLRLMDDAFGAAGGNDLNWQREVYRALYAHLTAPKTITAERWHVHYAYKCQDGWDLATANRASREEADILAKELGRHPFLNGCIHITGPHKQEVPA